MQSNSVIDSSVTHKLIPSCVINKCSDISDYVKGLFEYKHLNFPVDNCIRNIAIGILMAGVRVAIYISFFSTGAFVPLSSLQATIFVIKSCIVAPIFEEVVFREVLLGRQLKKLEKSNASTMAKMGAVLVSGLLFGAFHFVVGGRGRSLHGRVLQMASSAIGGVIYGAQRAFTGNLWASTVTHSLFNASFLFRR